MEKAIWKQVVIWMMAGMFFSVVIENAEAYQGALKKEDRGASVKELQEVLINMGYLHSNATGYYGPLTDEAVQQFQNDFGLGVDGISGANTLRKVEDVKRIAQTVHGEARGESFEGQVAVAAVIRNRLNSPQFPETVEEVITERNAFTAVQDGQYYLEPNTAAYQAVREAWRGRDPSQGSHYYYNPVIATSDWILTRTTKLQIGKHVFAN
ncbi:cell wall hydrolase [Alteribacillus bidgolensis]|uniref:N-acetylmuramoyl-L-alanine amidase n=1 Tax=Alteribacillus bidgolensis TaxID=930129 RepID=A0A1G8IIT0_9BACI|nr:cell wall hydrolase [Alteribacillus bidgolensis]SDI18805.1 N-acetylmuramoyl-L-alanine amidase [Alteribacillus bidgolensis]